jgi:phosphonate transport system substrate-binding protein
MCYKVKRIYIWLFVLIAASCTHKQDNNRPQYGNAPDKKKIPVYSFAIHPLHNPNKLMQVYQPLIDYLNVHIKDAKFVLEASRDYASYEKKYMNQKPELILPNPWQTIQAMKVGYQVIAMAGESSDFKGIFIVRKNSNIRKPQDLKGKSVSYPASTALAACIMPQYFLYCSGINISTDIENKYVGSQESSIMNVYLGLTVAGATWPPPWRAFQKEHPNEAATLKVVWETEPLINNSVMIRHDVPSEIQNQVKKCLVNLHETEQGRAILADMETARFFTANDKDYDIVRKYVERFESKVRRVVTK